MKSLLNLFLCFLPLLIFKSVHASDSGKVYTVVPSPHACLADSCLTLSQFAKNYTNYIASNTTLIITGDNHNLHAGMSASNIAEFNMLSSNIIYQASKPIITCTNSGSFNFSNIGRIRIKGLKIESCNGNKFEFIHQLVIEYSTFIGSKSPLTITNSNVSMIGAYFLFNSGSYKRDFALERFVEHSGQSFNNASIGGALILICTTIAIENCNFEGNTANFGGAIFSELANSITISNSHFNHNQANGCISGYCAGGAILINKRGKMTINNTTFYNNTSDFDGGVAVIINATLQVSHNHISHNAANRYGGVLAAFKNSNFILDSTLLYNNKAEDYGGTVYLHRSNTTVSTCGILCSNAKNDGGAIYGTHSSTVNMNNCVLKTNKAHIGNGGALYGQNQSTIAINNCEFIHNAATSGGVIDVNLNSILHIVNSNFSDNNASNNAGGGVAHVHNNSMVFIQHCNFIDNKADSLGGAVFVEKSSKMNISGCNIVNNIANYGGGLDVRVNSTASIASCNFTKNRAKNNGAALHVYVSSAVTITDSVFTWNTATKSGAAVYGRRHCNISIIHSLIYNCTADSSGGGAYLGHDSNIHVENCTFLNSRADFGGAIRAYVRTNVTILSSNFNQSRAAIEGGALHAYRNSTISVQNSNFTSNKARSGGVALALLDCELTFQYSTIINSSAEFGGVIGLLEISTINITGGTFTNNTAQSGGVLYAQSSKVVVEMNATFNANSARLFGGVIHANDNCTITTSTATFNNNTADYGGVLSLLDNCSCLIQYSDFVNNKANSNGGVIYVNNASIRVYSSEFNSSSAFMRGGILSASSVSRVYIAGSNFSHGTAKLGAALAIIESSTLSFILQNDLTELLVNSSEMPIGGTNDIVINNSTAIWSGGGIYLRESSFHIGTETTIRFNKAGSFGGGIHAKNSSIFVNHIIHFVSNEAMSGGGLSLSNSNLHDVIGKAVMNFVSNQAEEYGGALYNNDKKIADVCSGEYPSNSSGCFFQNVSDAFMINFDKNQAKYKGKDLFGGLLDRCTIASSSTNQSQLESNGATRFISISSITLDAISSKPIQVCFCENHQRNCSIRSKALEVKYRDTIMLELVAIDQVNHEIIATIQSDVTNYNLSVSEATQTIGATCSNISYHITAPPRRGPYEAKIYAEGPCSDKGISKLTVNINVIDCKCAIGLVTDNNNDRECKCKCDQQLLDYGYIKECDPIRDSVKRNGVFWISVTNKNDGNFSYLFFPYCPMGYCQPPINSIHVNLSNHNGSDAQCANNHGGLLCGKCRPKYSFSLGSSNCIQCHKEWHGQLIGITIAALFAGIFLVVIILVLNLTVAIGTLNSVIFYANIVYSSRILTQSQLSSAFISWLNVDIGFDVCFYKGMDAYTKTWLELAFPTYIIFLVVVIIWISSCSSTFSNLIGKRNPVATLATLILISYAKFLQAIIITFSFVKSNGSITPATRWLYDASIVYFGWKHALLFFTAVFILIFGLFYTTLLFSWQWLLHCPRSKVFNWTRNQKLHSFIDAYHIPHTAKHRYWTGLLLLVRVILYLIAAFSASVYADPHIPLLATIVVICCLLLYKNIMMIKVYRNWLLNAMDTFMCFNIVIPAMFTLHTFTDKTLQTKVIDISVGTTIVLLCFIIAFHVYRYGSMKLYMYCQHTKLCEHVTRWLSFIHSQQENSSSSPSDGMLLDVLESLRQGESEEIYDQHDEPTSSVVSLVHSEESPSSDYYLELNEGENQSDYILQSDKGNVELQAREKCPTPTNFKTQIRSTCDKTKKSTMKNEFSSYDDNRKPLLNEICS